MFIHEELCNNSPHVTSKENQFMHDEFIKNPSHLSYLSTNNTRHEFLMIDIVTP